MNLETRSSYFIRHLEHTLNDLTNWEYFSNILIDYTKITASIVNIIISFDNIDLKLAYF